MEFLVGDDLNKAISKVLRDPKPRCAVAFWGTGVDDLFGESDFSNTRIVCNLAMGGTNPAIIRILMKGNADVRQEDFLHAKVYLGGDEAVIASANASANGLGLESSAKQWIEAGVLTKQVEPVSEWFEKLWQTARKITDADLKNAEAIWKERSKLNRVSFKRASFKTFGDLDPSERSEILITWEGNDDDWDLNKPGLEKELGDYDEKTLEELVANGVTIEGKEDRDVLKNGTWVLCWTRTRKGQPAKNMGLRLVCCGEELKEAFHYSDETERQHDVVMPSSRAPLFNVEEDEFVKAFRDVMERDGYEALRTDDYEEAWFTTDRIDRMREFWQDVGVVYNERRGGARKIEGVNKSV